MFLNNADNIGYDNRRSGLEAVNVQDALDEGLRKKAVLSFEVEETSTATAIVTKSIKYPKGFSKENTMIIGVRYMPNTTENWTVSYFSIDGRYAYLKNDEIEFRVQGYSTTGTKYEVLLERIDVQ